MPKKTNTTNRPERFEEAYQEWKMSGGILKELAKKYDVHPSDLSKYISKILDINAKK